ncbi:AfsR/SARP family transcriptional regulator [Amycolatopsis xylanica]|uniref:AfsR/SARP family transcriptional regulator n=1 Tax=Amycolatopsis xylanica TaxID=589385 RepID=UPI000B8A518A|nr:BTAD domain-containing putative transcriptional regulator [Amycolatopsis xylanica]
MRFQVLGPLAASVPLPSAAQPRRLLAILLARPNEFVHRDALVDELWPDGAPSSAAAIVQVTVSKLRKVLGEQRLRNGPLGYRLTVEPGDLDTDRFLALADAGALEEALGCWRGPAFEDVAGGPLVEAHKVWLNDRRWSVFRRYTALELERGRHREVVDELAKVVADRPTDEQLVAQFVVALDRCGRRDAALRALDRARVALWEQAAVRPGDDLHRLYRRIAGREWTSGDPPAQLPATLPDFVGRAVQLAELERERGLVVLHGPPGIGKTALAVQAARRARKRFPDGQLYAEIGRLAPRDVLAGFLAALGVEPPEDLNELVGLWRGQTSDRRLLIVLDGVVSERQLRSLLPSGPGCLVLATSRRRLLGLPGQAVEVGELAEIEDLLGRERVLAEPVAGVELIRLCRGLPLAARVAGAKLAQRPHLRVSELAERMADETRVLDELIAGDLSVRSALSSAMRERSAEEREALRLLATCSPEVTEWSAAALLGLPVPAARDLLDALVDGHLVKTDGRDALGSVRYVLPDFVRLFWRAAPDPGATGRAFAAVLERLAVAYGALAASPAGSAHTVSLLGLAADGPEAAVKLLNAGSLHWEDGRSQRARRYFELAESRFRTLGDDRGTGASLVALADVHAELGDGQRALSELREALVLLKGDAQGQSVAAYQLGSLLEDLGDVRRAIESFELSMLLAEDRNDQAAKRYADVLRRHGRHDEAGTLLEKALGNATRAGEQHWEAHVLRSLGDLHTELGEPADGGRHLARSLRLFEQLGHRHAAAYTHRSLADACHLAGDQVAAEGHLRTAMTTFADLGDRRGAGYALLSLGRIRGDASAFTLAANLFRELGFPLWELRALAGLNSRSQGCERTREALTKISGAPGS